MHDFIGFDIEKHLSCPTSHPALSDDTYIYSRTMASARLKKSFPPISEKLS